jgi:hypothetical protein
LCGFGFIEFAVSDNYVLQKIWRQNINIGVQKFDADSQSALETIATEVATKKLLDYKSRIYVVFILCAKGSLPSYFFLVSLFTTFSMHLKSA